MGSYEIEVMDEFNGAVRTLRNIVERGTFDNLSRINNLTNDPTISKLISAIRELSKMEKDGLLSKLSNLDEISERLSRASTSYEINELTAAINNLNSAMNNNNVAILSKFADSLKPEHLNVIANFVKTVTERGEFEIKGLSSFEAATAQISNQVNSLGIYVQQMQQEIIEMKKSNIDIRLRNYLDILKDEDLINRLGLTREIIAQAIADELNKLGFPITYLGLVMSEDTDTKAKGK